MNTLKLKQKIRPYYHFLKNFRNTVLMRPYWGHMAMTAQLDGRVRKDMAPKIFMYEHTAILGRRTTFIISPVGEGGRFIMKKYAGASSGMTVITGNHAVFPQVGKWCRDGMADHLEDEDKDVIVEEDVWIGANVTLMPGVVVGRGSIIGAGSVLRSSVPPYSIIAGNPAKVVGFKFTPEEVIAHEKALYPEAERLPIELLEKNYNKYFISRIKEIKQFTKL